MTSTSTTTTTVTVVAPADLDAPIPACFFCRRDMSEWSIVYNACRHHHLACDRCKRRIEQRQQEADEATPPRPYASKHLCCGATIFRATWVRL